MIDIKNKKIMQIAIVIILALISSVVMYRFLPAVLEQRGGGTMPKLEYVIISFLSSLMFSLLYYFKEKKAFLYCATLGIVIPIFAYFFGNVF